MSKVEDILASTKVGDVLDAAKLNKFLKRQEEEEKKPSKFVIVFAVIGIVVAVAAAIYGIYRFLYSCVLYREFPRIASRCAVRIFLVE